VDTLRLIKINDNQLYVELSSTSVDFSKKITVNFPIESIKNLSRKITHDILNRYIKNGVSTEQLKQLKKIAYELFNILDFFKFEQYFNQIIRERDEKNHYLHFIIDPDINSIPFEILHNGKEFLSDFLILSREFINSNNIPNNQFKIESNQKFSIVGNPSESEDIEDNVMNEISFISNIVESNFNLGGPFKHRNVDKVELIKILGSNSLFHFSGHYQNGGWKLFNDIFQADDIFKCSRSSDFIFSNSCGHYTEEFINFINAFLNKGTKTIISSLGKLPSAKATEFSKIFYKFFIHFGHSAGKSLFLTKKEMIKKYGHQDLFWCYYQLYGSSLLSIDKKNKLESHDSKKSKIKYSIFFFILISYLSYNFIFNGNVYQKELDINIQSNISSNIQLHLIKIDSIMEFSNNSFYPLFLKCDSILTGQPYFSLIGPNQEETFQLIIDNDSEDDRIVRYPYHFNNQLLSVYLSDKTNFNRIELIFEDNIEYSVYLQYEKRDSEKIFMFHMIDILNDTRYKINIKQLYNILPPIHKDYLKAYRDESPFSFPRDSEFELIKKDFKFKNRLVLDIKKALIK